MATLQEILTILSSQDNSPKITLLQTMAKSPSMVSDDAIIQKVSALAKDSDMAVRFWSKKVIAKATPPKETMITSKTIEKPVTIDLLLQKLETADSALLPIEVIQKLFESRDSRALKPLAAYLKRCVDPVQISYLTKNLGVWFPSEALLPVLMPYLKHNDDRVIASTVEGLEAIGSDKAVIVYAQLLNHRSNRVRANAAKALSITNAEVTAKILAEMLALREKPHFVISACHAIGALKAKSFLPKLKELMQDDLLFCDVLKTIETIGGSPATMVMREILAETSDEEKQNEIQMSIARMSSNISIEGIQVDSDLNQKNNSQSSNLPHSKTVSGSVSESSSSFSAVLENNSSFSAQNNIANNQSISSSPQSNNGLLAEEIREELKKFSEKKTVLCLECGYHGLMGVKEHRLPCGCFFSLLAIIISLLPFLICAYMTIEKLFPPDVVVKDNEWKFVLMIPAIVVFVIAASRKTYFVCPNCKKIIT